MDPGSRARLRILAAAALFSSGGAAIKATSLGRWQVASFRSGVAALALLVLVPAARRGWTWRTGLVGVAYAATLVLFVLANKLTTSANAIFLQSTAPLYLLLLSPWLLRERIRLADLVYMAALGVGLGMFFLAAEEPRDTAPDPRLGDLLAAASGLTWALSVSGLRWLARDREDGGAAAAGAAVAGNVLAFLVALPFALPVVESTAADWLWIAFLGTFQIGLAYACLTSGVRWIPALEGSLLLLLEPVLNPVWSWLFHGEVPGPWARAGAAVILVATAAHALRAARREGPAPT